MFTNNYPSLSDIASVTNGNNGMFGGDGWWAIILFALIFGWGRNGNAFGGNGGVSDGYVLTSDFANIERKLDSVNNGLCDGFYTQAQLVNGVNQNISNTGFAIQNAITQDTIANMQNTNALATQLSNCCCENREAISGLNYNLATQNCATNNNISNGVRDIVDNQNANTRAVLDALNKMEINAKDEKIAEQSQKIFDLQLSASQQEQNSYIINSLRPPVTPSYVVPNPYASYGGYGFGCSCNG